MLLADTYIALYSYAGFPAAWFSSSTGAGAKIDRFERRRALWVLWCGCKEAGMPDVG